MPELKLLLFHTVRFIHSQAANSANSVRIFVLDVLANNGLFLKKSLLNS
jgi:hypothetical protein